LPHWDAINARVFVTFRLHGTLPDGRIFHPTSVTGGQAFVAMDRLLDHARTGPMFLSQPEIAQMVMDAIHDGERRFHRYDLHSFVVMPNHVHLLVTSRVPSAKWLRSLKGFTAHRALELLNHSGAFWQNESYDHLVRNDQEFRRIHRYIERNPVKAGLVSASEDFRGPAPAPESARSPVTLMRHRIGHVVHPNPHP
jgi:putative transposase